MLHTVTARILAIAACGWLLAWDASALTLGRARSAALIGRPLEVAIPVTLDTPSSESPCASADLYYGDFRVAPPSVRWEPGAGSQGVLRVTSTTPVDEPMVTLYLRVGCGQSSSRRFVFLTELPPEVEPQRQAPPLVRPPVVAAPSQPAATPRAVPRAERALPAAPPAARAAAPAPAPRAVRTPPARPQARLKLEPLELGIEREPALRLSSQLASQLATDPRQREAAAALWQALQMGPEQALQEAIRLQGVERELNSLRTATRENAAALGQMRAQMEQAQGGRQSAGLLVLGLVLVLAALLAWLAWRWHHARRLEQVGRWFEAHGESVQAPLPPAVPPAPVQPPPKRAPAMPSAAATTAKVATAATAATAAAAVTAVTASRASAAPAPATGSPPSTWGTGFQASRTGTMRTVGVEELLDVHDKADFFLSIGETQQAIAVLETHVHDQVDTSALAWMDLLELYHSLGRRADFERLRAEFRQRFTVQVPDFEHFDQPTASLENYSRALSRIVALWPAPKVLDVIEESIFRKPGLPGAEPFSLEAYRELVLLYHVAREITPVQDAADPGNTVTGFPHTSLQPLDAVDRPEPAPAASGDRDRLMIPPASSRLGVDIDLGELPREDQRELPMLDFDVSAYEDADATPERQRR